MKKELAIFEKLTNITATNSKRIKKGITNINYKVFTNDGVFVMRMPRKNVVGINFTNQQKVLEKVSFLNVDVVCYDASTGILITKYEKLIKKDKPEEKDVIKHLKKLHSINCENIDDFDVFNLLNVYKNIVKENHFENEATLINKVKSIYEKYEKVLCHNDLLFANFLYSKDRSYLIDYEYSGKNIALFDVVSYLNENNINDESKQLDFIKQYYKIIDEELLNDINIMFSFLDVLWGYWGFAMYKMYKNKTFLSIGEEKKSRYHSRFCN